MNVSYTGSSENGFEGDDKLFVMEMKQMIGG